MPQLTPTSTVVRPAWLNLSGVAVLAGASFAASFFDFLMRILPTGPAMAPTGTVHSGGAAARGWCGRWTGWCRPQESVWVTDERASHVPCTATSSGAARLLHAG